MPDVCGSGQEGVLVVFRLEHEQHDGWPVVVVAFRPAAGKVPAVGLQAGGHASRRRWATLELEEVRTVLSPVLQQKRGVRMNDVAFPVVAVACGRA